MIRNLCVEIRATNIKNGWNPPSETDWVDDVHKVPCFLALIHSEVSEALEAFRKGDRNNFAEELADVIIRTLDLGHGLGFDMQAEIADKMEFNRNRPHKHGGKAV